MRKLIDAAGRFVRAIPKWLLETFVRKPGRFFRRRGERFAARMRDWKAHPVAFRRGLSSFFIPGLGQFRNRQWYKAIPFFAFFFAIVAIEMSTSNYLAALTEIGRYPIVTQDMIEGGAFYQTERQPGTIVGGLLLTAADVAAGGDYFDTYREAGDFVAENGAYALLDEDDVASGGDYHQSYHVVGDVVPAEGESPTLLTTDDLETGPYAGSLVAVGDIVMRTLTETDVAEGGAFYDVDAAVGHVIRYTVVAADLWAEGAYYQTTVAIGDILRAVIVDEDLAAGGLFEGSGLAVGDVGYIVVDADNVGLFTGFLAAGDIRNGVILDQDSTEDWFQVGDLAWVEADQAYKQLTNANVNTVGAAYYQTFRTAGTIVSADGVTPPVLMTPQLVAPQGSFYGVPGVSAGSVKFIAVAASHLAEGGLFAGRKLAKGDKIFVMIDAFDIEPNQIDLLIEQGYYREVLGVEVDNVVDRIQFFRDYGGFFAKGIWGLITLGRIPTQNEDGEASWYRGWPVIVARSVNQSDYPSWVEADNSRSLMTQGVIVLVVTLIVAAVWAMNVRDAYRSRILFEKTGKVEEPARYLRRLWDENFGYIITLPTFLLIAFFTLIPFMFSFLTGFTSWDSNVAFPQELFEWEGLVSFNAVFARGSDGLKYFGGVFAWTLVFAVLASVTCYVAGLIQALIIESKHVAFKKFWRTVYILPWAIPSLVTLLMFRNIFSSVGGLANQVILSIDGASGSPDLIVGLKTLLYGLGLYREQVPGTFDASYITWFGFLNYRLGRTLIILINLWIGFPYFMLLITGTLTSIPSDMYEAADIDGASSFQKTRYITLPWILRATTPVIITTLTHNFNNFGVIYFLTGSVQNVTYTYNDLGQMINVGVPNSAPSIYDILISWVYRLAMLTTVREFNLASVYSIVIFLMVGTFSIYNLSRVKSFWEED